MSPGATLARRWPQIAWQDPGASPTPLPRWGEAVCRNGAGCWGWSCSFSAESYTQSKTSDGESSRTCRVCLCAGPPASVHVYVGTCVHVSARVCARLCGRVCAHLSGSALLAGLAFQEVVSPACAHGITGFGRPPWHTCPV